MLTTGMFLWIHKMEFHTIEVIHGAHWMGVLLALTIIPMMDAIRVAMTRIINGKGPFSADKTHIHHMLLKMNLNHGKASLLLWTVQIIVLIVLSYFQVLNVVDCLKVSLLAYFLLVTVFAVLYLISSLRKIDRFKAKQYIAEQQWIEQQLMKSRQKK